MNDEQFAAGLVEAIAIALFDVEEKLAQEVIAQEEAKGNFGIGHVLGRHPERWDDPKNAHCHVGYRRRAIAALEAMEPYAGGAL